MSSRCSTTDNATGANLALLTSDVPRNVTHRKARARPNVKHQLAGECKAPAPIRRTGRTRLALLRAMTRGVVPLPFGSTCRLTRCRCLPCLLASPTALTPSANPLSKPGLHHSHLPLPHGRAMASQAGRFAPPADPGLAMPANVSAQAQSRIRAYARAESGRQYRQGSDSGLMVSSEG